MSLSQRDLDDPLMVEIGAAVSAAMVQIAQHYQCEAQLRFYESTANIAVDKMTALILRAKRDALQGA